MSFRGLSSKLNTNDHDFGSTIALPQTSHSKRPGPRSCHDIVNLVAQTHELTCATSPNNESDNNMTFKIHETPQILPLHGQGAWQIDPGPVGHCSRSLRVYKRCDRIIPKEDILYRCKLIPSGFYRRATIIREASKHPDALRRRQSNGMKSVDRQRILQCISASILSKNLPSHSQRLKISLWRSYAYLNLAQMALVNMQHMRANNFCVRYGEHTAIPRETFYRMKAVPLLCNIPVVRGKGRLYSYYEMCKLMLATNIWLYRRGKIKRHEFMKGMARDFPKAFCWSPASEIIRKMQSSTVSALALAEYCFVVENFQRLRPVFFSEECLLIHDARLPRGEYLPSRPSQISETSIHIVNPIDDRDFPSIKSLIHVFSNPPKS